MEKLATTLGKGHMLSDRQGGEEDLMSLQQWRNWGTWGTGKV